MPLAASAARRLNDEAEQHACTTKAPGGVCESSGCAHVSLVRLEGSGSVAYDHAAGDTGAALATRVGELVVLPGVHHEGAPIGV